MSISYSEGDDWLDDWSEDFDDRDGSYWEQYIGGPEEDAFEDVDEDRYDTHYEDNALFRCDICREEITPEQVVNFEDLRLCVSCWRQWKQDSEEEARRHCRTDDDRFQEELFMAAVNKAIIVGNLGKDPEVRFTQSGRAVANFPVATTDTWMDQESGRQERTEWHNIVVWGKQAESCGQYLSKGRQVYIEGSIRNRSYDDREGNKRYISEIVAQRVQFLGGGSGGAGGGRPGQDEGGGGRSGQNSGGSGGGFDDFGGAPPLPDDDDVPF